MVRRTPVEARLEVLQVGLTPELYNELRRYARAITHGEQSASLVNKWVLQFLDGNEAVDGTVPLVAIAKRRIMRALYKQKRAEGAQKRGGLAEIGSFEDNAYSPPLPDPAASDLMELLANMTTEFKTSLYSEAIICKSLKMTNQEIADRLKIGKTRLKTEIIPKARAYLQEKIDQLDRPRRLDSTF
jgi:hypothetical protein